MPLPKPKHHLPIRFPKIFSYPETFGYPNRYPGLFNYTAVDIREEKSDLLETAISSIIEGYHKTIDEITEIYNFSEAELLYIESVFTKIKSNMDRNSFDFYTDVLDEIISTAQKLFPKPKDDLSNIQHISRIQTACQNEESNFEFISKLQGEIYDLGEQIRNIALIDGPQMIEKLKSEITTNAEYADFYRDVVQIIEGCQNPENSFIQEATDKILSTNLSAIIEKADLILEKHKQVDFLKQVYRGYRIIGRLREEHEKNLQKDYFLENAPIEENDLDRTEIQNSSESEGEPPIIRSSNSITESESSSSPDLSGFELRFGRISPINTENALESKFTDNKPEKGATEARKTSFLNRPTKASLARSVVKPEEKTKPPKNHFNKPTRSVVKPTTTPQTTKIRLFTPKPKQEKAVPEANKTKHSFLKRKSAQENLAEKKPSSKPAKPDAKAKPLTRPIRELRKSEPSKALTALAAVSGKMTLSKRLVNIRNKENEPEITKNLEEIKKCCLENNDISKKDKISVIAELLKTHNKNPNDSLLKKAVKNSELTKEAGKIVDEYLKTQKPPKTNIRSRVTSRVSEPKVQTVAAARR